MSRYCAACLLLYFVKATIEPAQHDIVERLAPRAVNCHVTIAPFTKRRLHLATGPVGLALGKPRNEIGSLPAILYAARQRGRALSDKK